MKIIPAIDIIEGKCVRLTQGDYTRKKVYNENPLEVAKQFENQGIKQLHLVDLDGAKSGRIINHRILNSIASNTNLKIDFGGGLKRDEDLKIAFENGANQITGGTIAVKNRDLFLNWLEIYGSEKIILGADVRNQKVAVNGWLEESQFDIFDFLKDYVALGIQYVICTDISRDGCLGGSALELYKNILLAFPSLKLIASGGVTSKAEIVELKKLGCHGAIIGKALYEGRINLNDLKTTI
ncbi:MAG: 1-(5-phosphoribosyl)-5-[(5-phosphoribosylamino)methylideneamino]imidazole-4-carboxamide isomerase [Bacteroidetes bacterium]|jgi:phosphoribosylformimino-5-aminoimidazole carboxamide ribotide isomerase|nr:1-(5-phosphoribosyl)-5-[(5-phosphoribosylamino)methylideneamino]imidazole-4-carboxamide isomerase [Bacteroidota bacterium]MDF1864678.1 1-(5-phosphoribosyl)-5-[(5-phosphoribosylamino)methylideneamino]imidazole-4-carboxamide isomerase [Saprospiraceae bacterium]